MTRIRPAIVVGTLLVGLTLTGCTTGTQDSASSGLSGSTVEATTAATTPASVETPAAPAPAATIGIGTELPFQTQLDAAKAAGFAIYHGEDSDLFVAYDPAQPLPENIKTDIVAVELAHLYDITKQTVGMWMSVPENFERVAKHATEDTGRNIVIVYPVAGSVWISAQEFISGNYWYVANASSDMSGDSVFDHFEDKDGVVAAALAWVAGQANPGTYDVIVVPYVAPIS